MHDLRWPWVEGSVGICLHSTWANGANGERVKLHDFPYVLEGLVGKGLHSM